MSTQEILNEFYDVGKNFITKFDITKFKEVKLRHDIVDINTGKIMFQQAKELQLDWSQKYCLTENF